MTAIPLASRRAVARRPQWSRPPNGRMTRHIGHPGVHQGKAAMEPTAERSDDGTAFPAAGPYVAAAMEPTAERSDDVQGREHVIYRLQPQWSRPPNGRMTWRDMGPT